MPRENIVKRLVQEIGDFDTSKDENLPIEYYEMRDYAKTRVLLKTSIKSHAVIFTLVNIFLFATNIFADPANIGHFFELWAFWVFLGWGFILWSHFVIVKGIIDIDDIDRKIFAIISLILVYIAGLLVFTNYISNYYLASSSLWWPWGVGLIVLIIGSYAYVVYQTDEQGSFSNRVKKEMKIIKAEAILKEARKSEEKMKDIKEKLDLNRNE